MRTRHGLALATALLATAVAAPAAAAPGDPDIGFADAGLFHQAVAPAGNNASAVKVDVRHDGRLLFAGHAFQDGPREDADPFVFGLTRDGRVDTTFGGGDGLFAFPVSDGDGNDRLGALFAMRDGRIIAAGSTPGATGTDFWVARLTEEGDLDASFSDDGILIIDSPGGGMSDAFNDVVVDPLSGSILLVGTGADGQFTLLQLDSDGDPDPLFGDGDGFVTTDLPNADRGDGAIDVFVLDDGTILVGGQAGPDTGIVEYTPEGEPFSGFGGGDGIVVISLAPDTGIEFFGGLGLGPDGAITVAASTTPAFNQPFRIGVARFDAAGALDSGFAGDGTTTTNFGGDVSVVRDIQLDEEGRLLVAGASSTDGDDDFGLLRLLSGGGLDAAFGDGGRRTYPLGDDDAQVIDFTLLVQAELLASGYLVGFVTEEGVEEPAVLAVQLGDGDGGGNGDGGNGDGPPPEQQPPPPPAEDPTFGPRCSVDPRVAAPCADVLAELRREERFFEADEELAFGRVRRSLGDAALLELVAYAGNLGPDPSDVTVFLTQVGGPPGTLPEFEPLELAEGLRSGSVDRLPPGASGPTVRNVREEVVYITRPGRYEWRLFARGSANELQPANNEAFLTVAVNEVADSEPRRPDARAGKPPTFTGEATGAELVQVAIAKQTGGAGARAAARVPCRWVKDLKARLRPERSKRCQTPTWLNAKGTDRWKLRLKRPLKRGRYVLHSRAIGEQGLVEAPQRGKDGNRVAFKVKKKKRRSRR